MTVGVKQRNSLAGEHDDPAKIRKYLESGLAGPAEGSAGALLGDSGIPIAMALSQTSRGIAVTPPEVCVKRLDTHQAGWERGLVVVLLNHRSLCVEQVVAGSAPCSCIIS